jgi:uncharacterized repeat protein (TIGR01451 family)
MEGGSVQETKESIKDFLDVISRNETKKRLISLVVLALLFSPTVDATTIDSNFVCKTTDGESTFYSYLREPQLEATGYSRGFKTGTFNYFKGGTVILSDKIRYYDGTIDDDHPKDSWNHNSSVKHSLTVDFESLNGKGISEFYAKGFYTNNRAVAAWKKIWYGNSSYYPSRAIQVQANATMDLQGEYLLKYHATAEKALFVFSDSSGWSNRTGARRIDWEQGGLIKGKQIDVTNDLRAGGLFVARGGGDDWLPCCMLSGTIPPVEPIEGNGSEWPSAGVYATLLPEQLLPTTNCTAYRCNPCKNGKKACSKCSLIPGCKDFSCIYSLGGLPSAAGPVVWTSLPPLQLASYFEADDEQKIVDYTIDVRNYGSNQIQEAVLVDKLPESSIVIESTVNDIPKSLVLARGSDGKDYFTYRIGTLEPVTGPEGRVSFRIKVKLPEGTTNLDELAKASAAQVTYRVSGGGKFENTSWVNPSQVISESGGIQ